MGDKDRGGEYLDVLIAALSPFFLNVYFVLWDDTSWGVDLYGGAELLLSKRKQLIDRSLYL